MCPTAAAIANDASIDVNEILPYDDLWYQAALSQCRPKKDQLKREAKKHANLSCSGCLWVREPTHSPGPRRTSLQTPPKSLGVLAEICPSYDEVKVSAVSTNLPGIDFETREVQDSKKYSSTQGAEEEHKPTYIIHDGEKQLNYIVSEFLAHYHEERPHQGNGNVPVLGMDEHKGEGNEIVCRERLGGLLKHSERRAA